MRGGLIANNLSRMMNIWSVNMKDVPALWPVVGICVFSCMSLSFVLCNCNVVLFCCQMLH
jgi:hypothetical protein